MATSYANPGGSGDRSAIIDISTTLTTYTGNVAALIDGDQDDEYRWNFYQTTGDIVFDFKVGASKVIEEATLYLDSEPGSPMTTFQWWGREDGSSNWDIISADIVYGDTGSNTLVMPLTPEHGYRYYRFIIVDGFTDLFAYKREMEFKIDELVDTVTITDGPTGGTNPVASEGEVGCSVTAVDNSTHNISYLWSAPDGGSFVNDAVQYATWTAPANTTGSTVYYTISVTATCDGSPGDSATSTYEQGVLSSVPVDTVTITVNPTGSPNPIASSGTVNCSVTATDNSGHAVSYLWTTIDGGSFNNNTLQNPIWTAPVNITGSTVYYTLGVTATCDGTPGDSASSSYEQGVLTGAGGTDVITITSGPTGSPNPVSPSGTVGCTVTAIDASGHTIGYSWSAPDGGSFVNSYVQNPVWIPPIIESWGAQYYTISVSVICSGAPPVIVTSSYEQAVSSTYPDISNIDDFYKIGGPHAYTTGINTSGWLGVGTRVPVGPVDVSGIVAAKLDGVQVFVDHTNGDLPRVPNLVYTSGTLVAASSVPEGTIGMIFGVASGVPGSGANLPVGTENQTLRHDGDDWVANSLLQVYTPVGTGAVKISSPGNILASGNVTASGTVEAGQSLWGASQVVSPGTTAINLTNCNMVTCTLTSDTTFTTTSGGHIGQIVSIILLQDVTGEWRVTFSTGFDSLRNSYTAPANNRIGLLFAYDGSVWKELGPTIGGILHGEEFRWVFKMVDSLDFATPEATVVPVVTLSKDGAAFGALTGTPAVTEIGNGWYYVDVPATDMNIDAGILKAIVAGCAQTDFAFYPQ
jgi:hypothetical protein